MGSSRLVGLYFPGSRQPYEGCVMYTAYTLYSFLNNPQITLSTMPSSAYFLMTGRSDDMTRPIPCTTT